MGGHTDPGFEACIARSSPIPQVSSHTDLGLVEFQTQREQGSTIIPALVTDVF